MTALAALCAIAACGGDPASDAFAASKTCNPLKGEQRPIELGKVIAVGRDADGLLYVLVQPDEGEYQVFVSEHGVLQRHRVIGSGTSNDPTWYSVSVEADPPFGLYVQIDSNSETKVRRFDPADVVDKNQVPDGEDLEVLSERDIQGMKLRNLPPDITIEYLGKIAGGRRVLVVRPSDDWSYEDFRVFLGTPNKMLERDVQNVARALDGGSTTIDFTIDGEPATLHFPVEFVDQQFRPGKSRLAVGADKLSITLVLGDDQAGAVDSMKFFCR